MRSIYLVPMLAVVKPSEAGPRDADLVIAARNGDQEAFRQLFGLHVKAAAGLAYRLLGGDDDVDDVVQESFAEALAKLGSLRDPSAFAGWLAAIVSAQVIRLIRRKRLLRRLGLLRGGSPPPEALRVAPIASAEVVAELRAVYAVVDSLPAEERVMLLLHRVEELTHQEIADRTGRSVATVKRRIEQAESELERIRGRGVR